MIKFIALLLLVALAALAGCTTWSPSAANSQELSWGDLHMRIPKDWELKAKEDSLVAESPSGSESLSITEFVPAPDFMATSPSPQQIIDREIELLSPPDPEAPEEYTIAPHEKFYLPCGEPASVVLQGLGGNEFVATYAVASDGKMYRLHFYRTGEILRGNRHYRSLVSTARVIGFPTSSCNSP